MIVLLMQILRTATFSADYPGYIAIPSDSVGENFDVTFRMRTTANSSLLMYTSDNDQVRHKFMCSLDNVIYHMLKHCNKDIKIH